MLTRYGSFCSLLSWASLFSHFVVLAPFFKLHDISAAAVDMTGDDRRLHDVRQVGVTGEHRSAISVLKLAMTFLNLESRL